MEECFIRLFSNVKNTESKPVPLRDDEGEVYMLALKQEMRGTMQRLPHNIKPLSAKSGEQGSQMEGEGASRALETKHPFGKCRGKARHD